MCARLSRLQVLLVDDEIDQLLPLADALRRGGLTTRIATSGDEVLFEIEMAPPDVVLLDSDLARRGLLSQLRASSAKLPVILMNSSGSRDATWNAMLATVGVTGVDKPVDVSMLLDLLADSSRF